MVEAERLFAGGDRPTEQRLGFARLQGLVEAFVRELRGERFAEFFAWLGE